MPKYWMISARTGGGTGNDRNKKGVTFWTSDSANDQGQPAPKEAQTSAV